MKNILHLGEHVASATMFLHKTLQQVFARLVLSCIIAFVLAQPVFSQSGPPANPNANQLKYIDILPPSPAVSSLANFNRPDVGMYSGAAKFNVPLGSIDLPGLTIPVSLNYATNGVKVDELASRVGMGWQLEAGGVITRTVRGSGADEKRTYVQPPTNTSPYNQAFIDYLTSALSAGIDSEPDIFTFSFCGINGSFILDENKKPVQLEKSSMKIEFVPSTAWDFKIIDSNGNEFYFGGTNFKEESRKEVVCSKSYNSFEVTAWFLQKIVLFNGEEVTFNYVSVPEYVYDLGVSQTFYHATQAQINQTGACKCPEFPVRNTCTNLLRVKTKALHTVVSRGKSLTLTYDTERSDCGDFLVYELDIHAGGNHDRYRLSFQYYTSNLLEPPSADVTIIGENRKRPFLNMVYRLRADGVWQKYYGFIYNNPQALPVRLSFAQDHWGYFNGKSNPSLMQFIPGYEDEFPTATANREVDTVYSKIGVLTKIYFPTGGYDSIEYETNRTSSGVVGGVRVKRIKSYTKPGSIVQTKRYRYATIAAPSVSTGVARYTPQYMKSITFNYTCTPSGNTCSYTTMSSSSFTNLFNSAGSPVHYSTVVEYLEGANTNGAIEHNFAVGTDSQGELLMGQHVNGGTSTNFSVFYGGKELKTMHYKKNGTSYEMMKRVTNFYGEQDSLYNQYYGVIVTESHSDSNPLNRLEATRYIVFSPWVTLDSMREETFANGQVLTQTVKYGYSDTKSLKPTTTTTKDNFDRTEVTYSYYPTMRDQVPGLAGSQHTYLGILKNKNNIGQVVFEKKSLNGAFNGQYELLYGSFSGKILPAEAKLYYQEGVLGGGFQIMGYDSYGNITQRKNNDGVITSYLWGYSSIYPIAEFKNTDVASVAATSFESAETGNWTISGTVVDTQTPPTGKQCLQLGSVQKVLLPGDLYTLSYWYKGGTVTIAGATVNSQITQTGPDGWTNVVASITSNTTLTLSGTGYVDDVRLYPAGAVASTYTYHPIYGLRTMSDQNNKINYFDYDVMGRLSLIRDAKKNIVKQFNYHLNEPTPQSGITYE